MIAYKYLHPRRTSVLEDGLIRFTQSPALNDPFETTPNTRKLEQSFKGHALRMLELAKYRSVVEEIVARSRIGPLIKKHLDEFHRMNTSNYAILSLSKIPNNLLMGAHYCDSHRGFVLGFDSAHTFFKTWELKRFSTLAEVHYSKERPIMPAPEEWDGSQEQIARVLSTEDLAELMFYTKSQDWEYEQELRMIANPKAANRRDKSADGQDIYLYSFPPECLKEVIFGIRMPRDQRLQIAKVVRDRYADVELFEAVLSEEKFDLDVIPFEQ